MTDTTPTHAGLEHILRHIDVESMRGLEIGPLHNPIVPKRPGVDVAYVDHADTETLRDKYADDPNVPFVLDVDLVWGTRRLADAVGPSAGLDYVIASHVIEHVPDLVSWLNELGEVLRPGGVVSLVIPDKRFCFDARRRVTDVSELIEAHLTKRQRPSLAQIFDFESRYVPVDSLAVWAGQQGYADEPLRTRAAYDKCVEAASNDDYVDVHATTWTPESLLDVMTTLFELDLVPLRIASFCPTPFNSLEFYVTFERLDDSLSADERRELQLRSLPAPVNPTDISDHGVADGDGAGRVMLDVSEREAKLVEQKRRLLEVSRRVVGRARRAVRRQP